MKRSRLNHRSKTNSRPAENLELRAEYKHTRKRCANCGSKTEDIHHIFGGRKGRADLRSNLLAVCRDPCHRFMESSKRDGRILALWLKMKLGELDMAEIKQASGLNLDGWLEINQPINEGYSRHWAELVQWCAEQMRKGNDA